MNDNMEKNTLLIVDDDKQSLQTLNYYLEKSPETYQILSAINGEVAFKILENRIPELVITDWDMPKMNGLELIQKIRQHKPTKDLPVIVVTGVNISPEHLKQALDVGATDFLAKPVNRIELYARTQAALKMYRALCLVKEQRQIIEDQKNRELSSQTIEITQKRHLLSSISEQVQDIAQGLKGKAKTKMRQLEKLIQSNLKQQNHWDTFKIHFENVHPHFFAQMSKKCAQLSQTDLRHCAYLKIGLSNKEIAQILNITTTSVITHHYRIKKKMKIDGDIKLADFIRQET